MKMFQVEECSRVFMKEIGIICVWVLEDKKKHR